MELSVVIPTLNESLHIGSCITHLGEDCEVIVVDGGSSDDTCSIARSAGAKVITTEAGRGHQLNVGARASLGDALLFLHADVRLPPRFAAMVEQTLSKVPAGAFRTHHVAERWRGAKSLLLRLADLRSRISPLPYGDQAMFMTRGAYNQVGGFPNQPLMEDLEMSRRLRKLHPLAIRRESVRVSGRRFESAAVYQTVLVNIFPYLYWAGVSPETLLRLYGAPR